MGLRLRPVQVSLRTLISSILNRNYIKVLARLKRKMACFFVTPVNYDVFFNEKLLILVNHFATVSNFTSFPDMRKQQTLPIKNYSKGFDS